MGCDFLEVNVGAVPAFVVCNSWCNCLKSSYECGFPQQGDDAQAADLQERLYKIWLKLFSDFGSTPDYRRTLCLALHISLFKSENT